MCVIGIDGGGTKTTGVIVDSNGFVTAKHTVGSTNPNSISLLQVKNEIELLFSKLKNQSPSVFQQVTGVFAGISGVDRADGKEQMIDLLQSQVSNDVTVWVDNDAVTALYSGTIGNPGIVNISGTGSITFGINEKGERDRVGGWGYILGDHGSGYFIGNSGLKAVFTRYDKIGESTILSNIFLQHFNVHSVPDLIPFIYEVGKTRQVVASLCELVIQAADEGDRVAIKILHDAAHHNAQSVISLYKKLFPDAYGKEIDIVLTGSVYQAEKWFLHIIKNSLLEKSIAAKIVVPEYLPVAGAVFAAWKNLHIPITNSLALNLRD